MGTWEAVVGSSSFPPSVLSPHTLSLSYLNCGSGLGGSEEVPEPGFQNKVGREEEDKEEEGEE